MHCNSVTKSTCRALMVLTVHHFTSSHMASVAAGCWSDLLPVTVLASLGAGINCTVYCVVVSHQSCIVFALCVVRLGLQEDVCNNACSLNISLRMWPRCWLCSVFSCFFSVHSWMETPHWKCIAHALIFSVVFLLILFRNSIYFSLTCSSIALTQYDR